MITFILIAAGALVLVGLLALVYMNHNRKAPASDSLQRRPIDAKNLRGTVRSAGGDD